MKAIRISRPLHLGVSLGADRVCAVRLGRYGGAKAREWTRPLRASGDGTEWPDLAEAFMEMRDTFGRTDRLSLVLLPPLVEARRLELPRLRREELRRVLSRDARRYFLDACEPQVVEAIQAPVKQSPKPTFAVAVRASLLQAVYHAAEHAGWDIETVVPAYSVWAAAGQRLWPMMAKKPGHLVIAADDRIEILRIDQARPVLVRRFLPDMDFAQMSSAIGSPPPDSIVTLAEPAISAARFADRAHELELVPEEVRHARRRKAQRYTRTLFVAATGCLALAALFELWGVRRELTAVQVQRIAIQASVRNAMAARAAVDSLEAEVATLQSLASSAPRWSVTIAAVAEHLPNDAYLTAFRGRPDTVELSGVAVQATGVFEALQRAPGIIGVRADAPIRQEQEGERRIERFALTGRLAAEDQ